MIAMIALLAMVWPKLGPTDCVSGWPTMPNFVCSCASTFWTCEGCSVGVEPWNVLGLRPLPVPFCTSGFFAPTLQPSQVQKVDAQLQTKFGIVGQPDTQS